MAKMFIGGESVDSVTKNTSEVRNPATARPSTRYHKATTRTFNRRFKPRKTLSKYGPTFRRKIAVTR